MSHHHTFLDASSKWPQWYTSCIATFTVSPYDATLRILAAIYLPTYLASYVWTILGWRGKFKLLEGARRMNNVAIVVNYSAVCESELLHWS